MRTSGFLPAATAALGLLLGAASALPSGPLNRRNDGADDAAAVASPTLSAAPVPVATVVVAPDDAPGPGGMTPHGRDAEAIIKALGATMYDPNQLWAVLAPAMQPGGGLPLGPKSNDLDKKTTKTPAGEKLRRRLLMGPRQEATTPSPPAAQEEGSNNSTSVVATTNPATGATLAKADDTKASNNGGHGGIAGEIEDQDVVTLEDSEVTDVAVSVAVADSCANCYNIVNVIVI